LVVLLSPQVVAVCGVEELHRRTHDVADRPEAAFEDVVDAEFPADLADVRGLAFVGERRVACDDIEVLVGVSFVPMSQGASTLGPTAAVPRRSRRTAAPTGVKTTPATTIIAAIPLSRGSF
jgi:hypothetical protein